MASPQNSSQATLPPYLTPAPFTPEELAVACQALANSDGDKLLEIGVRLMAQQLHFQGIKPREFIGDLYMPDWKLWTPVFSPDFDSYLTLDETISYFEHHGPTLAWAAWFVHRSEGLHDTAMNLVASILEKLALHRLSAADYLKYWLTEDRYLVQAMFPPGMPPLQPISQDIIEGPGILQIILNSTSIATGVVEADIRAHYLAMRERRCMSQQAATAFVAALPTVEPSAIPVDDVQCPNCWNDWNEASDADVNYTVKKTPCGHLFGHDCLVESLVGKSATCPTCRQDMAALAAQAPQTT